MSCKGLISVSDGTFFADAAVACSFENAAPLLNTCEEQTFLGNAYVQGKASGNVIASDLELSFWGGVDPWTGEVIDRLHPLSGRSLKNQILVIPGGRGSRSASGVVLELLLNGNGPRAMLFEREEDILTLGVVIAEELFDQSIPVLRLTAENFRTALNSDYIAIDGDLVSCSADGSTAEVISACERNGGHPLGEVELSERDSAYLTGNHGKAAQSAIRVVLRMAKLQGATQLMDVSQVHVDGCIYTGPGSLSFAEKLRDLGGRVVVPTTLNSISVDHRRWRSQGIDPALGEPASRLGDVYVEMGARPTFTCAPYLLETAPQIGEQVAWAESNAVIYANSVLGARTMKYPDFLDICIALTGRAPSAGPHLDINRKAEFRVNVVNTQNIDDSFFPLLGYHIGALASNRIPVIVGLEQTRPTNDDLKAFGAAFATVSSAPMFHIVGVTPKAMTLDAVMPKSTGVPSIDLRLDALASSWEKLNSAGVERVDLVSLGNPHFSLREIQTLASLCAGRVKYADTKVVVTCGRLTHDKASEAGLVGELERFGVQFVTDTCWCMLTDPIIPPTAKTILTNSGKYAHYGPGITGRSFYFGGLGACVTTACTGVYDKAHPPWLQ